MSKPSTFAEILNHLDRAAARAEIEREVKDLKARLASGERVPPERFQNAVNPDGTALTPGGFTADDHAGKRYAAPGCTCASCAGKEEKP